MTMFQTLNIMDGFDLANTDLYSSEYVHLWLEAMKLALIDDDLYNTGKTADIPVEQLISRTYADEQRSKIRPDRVAAFEGKPFPFHGTTSLSAADRWGNAVAFTQSLVSVFGSGVIAADTGIFLNNGHTFGFSLDSPDHANYIVGGERAKGVMSPCLVMRDGGCLAAVGAAGGYTIPQTVGQVIAKLLVDEMDIQLAIASPRHLVNRGGGLTPIPEDSVTYLETGYPPEVYTDLEASGHALAPPGNPGGVQAVYIDPETGALAGGPDPRRDGHAIAW
jgi:gamma-glutamyltranspeptidase/glutathione hydrolase